VKRILFAVLITFAMLLVLVAPVLAAPSPDNPGKGHPEFDKFVFVHYADNFAKRGSGDNNAPQLYSYSGYHWKSNAVSYWVNLTGNRIADTDALIGITASFQTWQDDPDSQIVFAFQGSTTSYVPGLNAASPDYQNVVGWAYLSDSYPGAIAVTIVWATRGNKLIVDSDTVLNTDSYFAWTQANITTAPDAALLPPTFGYDVDVQNIMTHESGHWLQLNDLYGSAAIEQTMYGYAGDRELKKRSLESGDLAGVKKVYP
jgi:hypothetical protein